MHTMIAYADNLNGAVDNCPGVGEIESLTSLINFFTCTLINGIIPLLFALALAGFVYGIITYFLNPDNEEKRKGGKAFMFWGIVTIFVMVSIWGLVGILSNTFLPEGQSKPFLPSLPEKK